MYNLKNNHISRSYVFIFYFFLQVKSLQEKNKDKNMRSLKLHKRKDLKVLLKEVKDLTTALCKKPYLKNTLLACGIQFGLTSSYYTLMVWFPELFTRYIMFICNIFLKRKKRKTKKKKIENKKYYKYFLRYFTIIT